MGNLCGTPKLQLSYKERTGTKSEGSAHPLPVIDETNGMIITERIQAPSHFLWKIESYSTLLQSGWKKIESGCFEVDGRKWKLTFHPNKNVLINQKRFANISLYLSLLDTEELPISWDLFVNFKFFVFDQIRDKYLVIQDINDVCRFQGMKTEWGFAQLLPLDDFEDPSNGFLLNDRCVFGVDIFVIKEATRGESFSVVKPHTSGNSYTFKIENFSTIDEEYVESNVFTIEGIKWMLRLYPKANRDGIDMVDLYLFLASNLEDCNNKVYASCNAHMINQVNRCIYLTPQIDYRFSNRHGFLICSYHLRDVNDAARGFLVNDTILLEVNFVYVSNVKHCS